MAIWLKLGGGAFDYATRTGGQGSAQCAHVLALADGERATGGASAAFKRKDPP
jgi:hypothetical protein